MGGITFFIVIETGWNINGELFFDSLWCRKLCKPVKNPGNHLSGISEDINKGELFTIKESFISDLEFRNNGERHEGQGHERCPEL